MIISDQLSNDFPISNLQKKRLEEVHGVNKNTKNKKSTTTT